MNLIYQSAKQVTRYGLVGITTNAFGYTLYLLITHFGVEPKLLITILYPLAALIGFYGNRQWVFAHKGAVLKSGRRYFIAHFFGYLINLLILFTFVDIVGYPHHWVQAISIFVVAGFLFIMFKYFVFPETINCYMDEK